MKLAFCLFKYFPFGGLQRDFLRIAHECVHRGHTVDVFTMEWRGDVDPLLNIHVVQSQGLQNHDRSRSFVKQLRGRLVGYDKIIGFNKMPGLDIYYAADTCYQAKARSQRAPWYRLTPRYRHLIAYEEAVFAADAQTHLLVLSPKQQQEFMQFYQTPAHRFHLLPPGISKDRRAPVNDIEARQEAREALGLAPHELLLLLVGSGFKTKGLDRILHGYASLPHALRSRCRLYIIGDDRSKPFLQLAKKLKIDEHVQFLGGRFDVPRFLLAADLLLHPAYNENTGTVLLEALAAGLPVLTTDVCGYAPYVQQANAGFVLPTPFQQNELNEALQRILLNDEERRAFRKNALKFTKEADIYSLPVRATDWIEHLPSLKKYDFDQMMACRGEVYRALEGRRTQRIYYEGETYFIKQYEGIGWKEILKNLSCLRLPVFSAKNEWQALRQLRALKVPVPQVIAYGCRGKSPAHLKSYLLMQALVNCISLEDFCKPWREKKPDFKLKQFLIKRVAAIAATLHQHGINHRDFYLCHFLLESATQTLYLIDLHRAQLRKKTPERWTIKDLSGLYFSSLDIGLTQRDYLRFMREYRNKSIRELLNHELFFWLKVKKRGNQLYQKQKQ